MMRPVKCGGIATIAVRATKEPCGVTAVTVPAVAFCLILYTGCDRRILSVPS